MINVEAHRSTRRQLADRDGGRLRLVSSPSLPPLGRLVPRWTICCLPARPFSIAPPSYPSYLKLRLCQIPCSRRRPQSFRSYAGWNAEGTREEGFRFPEITSRTRWSQPFVSSDCFLNRNADVPSSSSYVWRWSTVSYLPFFFFFLKVWFLELWNGFGVGEYGGYLHSSN